MNRLDRLRLNRLTLRSLHRHTLRWTSHHDRLLAHLIRWKHYRLALRHWLHHHWLLCHWLHHRLLNHRLRHHTGLLNHTRLLYHTWLLHHSRLLHHAWLIHHLLLRLLLVHHLLLRLLHHHWLLLLIHGLGLICTNLHTTWMLNYSVWIHRSLSLRCSCNRGLIYENLRWIAGINHSKLLLEFLR